MTTDIRGAANAKANRELAWNPAHPSWREGFRGIDEQVATIVFANTRALVPDPWREMPKSDHRILLCHYPCITSQRLATLRLIRTP
jgi:hypothetical protein